MRLARIPTGQPSGAWAVSIGLALQQRFREQATRSRVGKAGENQHRTVQGKYFTRHELLSVFRAEPAPERDLSGEHPKRASEYWRGAIAKLQSRDCRLIGFYAAVQPERQRRQGWKHEWLAEALRIRPSSEDVGPIMEIRGQDRKAAKVRVAKAKKMNPKLSEFDRKLSEFE
jgi:hypothetical protein